MTPIGQTQSLTFSWELPHPPAKVWRALTEPELLAQWLMETDLQPAAGSRFTFRQKPTPFWDGVVHCEMQELEPLKRLRYTWTSQVGPSRLDTVVTWTLTATAGGTRLELEHSGFTADNKLALAGAKAGWEQMVREKLAAVLARALL